MKTQPIQQAIRIAVKEAQALAEHLTAKKAKWELEKRRASYAFKAPLCCHCGVRKVGYWETPTNADYDQWCGECEIKPTERSLEAYRARRLALVNRTFVGWARRNRRKLFWQAEIEKRAPRSGYRGVYEHPGRAKPWEARISVAGKGKCLGYYATREQAARAYNTAAANAFGGEAVLNVIAAV